jgi:hypothetical protein
VQQSKGRTLDALVFGDGINYLPVRSRRADGSPGQSSGPRRRRSPRTICATRARQSPSRPGVNVLALSRMLGHKSAKLTLDTYADLFDTDLDAVAAALDLKCALSVPKRGPSAPKGADEIASDLRNVPHLLGGGGGI